jgi:putative membrane protein
LEPAVLERAVLEPAVLERAVLEPAVLERAVLEPAVLESAALESAVLGPAAPDGAVRKVAGPVAPASGWAAELLTGDLVRHGPAARLRRYVRAVGGAGALAAAGLVAWTAGPVPAWVGLGSLVLLPLGAILAADRYASLGHKLAGGWLVTRTGSLIRRRSVLSAEGIIGWRIHQSWFQRRQGLASLAATTAAGRQHYTAHDVPVGTALDLATAATPDLIGPFRTTR